MYGEICDSCQKLKRTISDLRKKVEMHAKGWEKCNLEILELQEENEKLHSACNVFANSETDNLMIIKKLKAEIKTLKQQINSCQRELQAASIFFEGDE